MWSHSHRFEDALQPRKDDRIQPNFSSSPFTSMYMGDVLATGPLLYAMLGAPLMDCGTSEGKPSRKVYDDHLELAKSHYRKLRNVGVFMDDTCIRWSFPARVRQSWR
jgi:hypothetical protein